MTEENKIESTNDKVSVKSAVTEEVKDKFENAANSLVQQAMDVKNPWYKKVALYAGAIIAGGLAFLFANFGDTIMAIIESWLHSLI